MRKYKFISTLRYLNISDPIKDGWFSLMPGIDITNNKSEISKVIDDEFKGAAGFIEYEHFGNANNIIYCEVDEDIFGRALDSEQALFIWLHWLKLLINDLWFIKDNAVVCEAAFCKSTDQYSTSWTRNSLTSAAYNSFGQPFSQVTLTSRELELWESKSCEIQTYLHSSKSTSLDSFTNTSFSRLARCMRFIRAAAREQHQAVKISYYCSAFESLFSTDNTGLSHKLSERVAIFLRDYGFNPLEVFDHFKSFYDIRSCVTHGSSIKPTREKQLSNLSNQCDDYLRTVILIVLDDLELRTLFDGKSDRFECYFKHKLLKF
jgi:hypothetical protein